VMGEVGEEVGEPRRGLGRRLQVAAMVAVGPDLPLTAKHHVQAARDGDREPTHAGAQRVAAALRVRLDHQMEEIGLDGEVDDPKVVLVAAATLGTNHAGDEAMDALLPERREAALGAQRDVHGMPALVNGPLRVDDTRALPLGTLSTGVGTLAAPASRFGE